jgi:hypothetical protein
MILLLLVSLAWGIWHGITHSGIIEVAATSAAIALVFMFFERIAMRRHEDHDLVAPWNRGAVWRQRSITLSSRALIFVTTTIISCLAQGVGYLATATVAHFS